MSGRVLRELSPGIVIVPKQASASGASFWIGVCLPAEDQRAASGALEVDVRVDVAADDHRSQRVSLTRYWFRGADQLVFFHGHLLVLDLPAAAQLKARTYPVGTDAGGANRAAWTAECTFKTLPNRVGSDPFRIVAASCFDIDTDAAAQTPSLCKRLFTDEFPDMTVLLGDQVYLDAPWTEFRRRTRRDPRCHYLTKYWSAWGRGRPDHAGLAPLLTVGANWFLPDDHEFWNNFPHATPLALHSFSNWRHIFRDRFKRTVAWVVGREIPPSLVEPPSPTGWDTWSRAAYELFSSFQTPSRNGEVSSGAADPEQSQPPPMADLVHFVDVGQIRFVFVDTRTQRSRSARHKDSGFIPKPALDRLIDLIKGPDVVVLALSQPVFLPTTSYRGFNSVRAFFDFDRGMENYRTMYPNFWRRLVDARSGRPTVFVGGDVHYNDVSYVPELALLQVVSSPMSLVTGLADLDKVRGALFGKPKRAREVAVGDFAVGHSGTLKRLVDFMSNRVEGVTTLDFSAAAGDVYELCVTHHPRDPEQTGYTFTFDIEPGHEDPKQRLRCRLDDRSGEHETIAAPG